MRLCQTVLLGVVLPLVAPAHAQQGDARIDRFVRAEMARQQIPGVAVAVVRGGTPVVVEGYGLANVEHQVPVTPDTIFQSGSVGKQFTAAAVMSLADEGRLALTDPLTTFFPDAPAHWARMTLRHLLTHTSGLPDYTAGTIDYRRDYTEEDLAKFAYGLQPEFEPGARWNYSNRVTSCSASSSARCRDSSMATCFAIASFLRSACGRPASSARKTSCRTAPADTAWQTGSSGTSSGWRRS